ncbi:hypothetical protein AMTR_s00077p00082450 [Amborella trichopoda]|uniref:Uncharacterized protein n=1 Tax=Amborella trichopoda TaxID=13333 RepID=W1P8C6_AMBTC|nr:hypothetical protein AMTR_s00077p00082450 [Amborella trichopoda]
MGDKATLTKARLELEELYAGVPDDSVNLTFKDLAGIKSKLSTENSRKSRTSPESVRRIDGSPESGQRTDEMVGNHWKNDKRELIYENSPGDMLKGSSLSKSESLDFMKGLRASQGGFEPPLAYSLASPIRLGLENGRERSSVYDEASAMDSFSRSPYRKRPGIPHTNICTLCSAYIYMFKHRCLS